MAETLNWVKLISVDPKWINDYLISHSDQPKCQGKIVTRVYSIRFSSNSEDIDRLVYYMKHRIPLYAFSKKELKELLKQAIQPWPEARDRYFGKVDPTYDGKCGEMLLYLFVEAVLGAPMIAHKIKCDSDNPNTQVHGSDGVFIGEYNGMQCMLLGEAKMRQTSESGLDDALKSVNKFYDPSEGGQTIRNELVVVRDMRSKSLSKKQFQYLEKVLNLRSEEYRRITKVHPVLIVYDESKIKEIEIACKEANDGEDRVSKEFQLLDQTLLSSIIVKINAEWQELRKVYLDFFFVPVSSIDRFRQSFYQSLWGPDRTKTAPKKRKRKRGAK